MEATQVNLALFWDDCLQVCYSQISWAAYLWELLRWAIGAALLAFVVHYCWYQFVWKQLTRIPDDARAPRKPQKRPSINDGNDMKGVMSFRERREKLALIGDVGDFLESLELFGYFERGAREIMKEMSREVLVKQGDSIPDGGHDFYILKQGRMRVCSHDEPEDLMALMVTLPGSPVASLFNIALAMLGDDSTAAIPRLFRMAEEDSTCVVIPAEAFRAIKERVPLQARTMVQAVFMRFQRITCSGLLQHLGLLDDLTVVEFAASSNCASSMPRGGDEAMPEIECLKDLQRKAVKVLLEALRMEAVGDLLDSTDLAHEAKVECVLTGQPICNESIYYVSSGVIAASSPESGAAHYVSAGGCLIVTSVLLGSKCPFQFKAMTACVLVRLERPSIMKIFEQCRGTCKSFVQLIVPRISSFLAFVDLGLNWIHVDAGTPVCFQDTAVNACYLVLHGRLRSVRRIAKGTDQVVEVGGGGNFGEAEIMNESEWPGTICAIRDSELARIPRDLFAMLLKARPSVSSTLAKTLALHPRHRQPNTERMSLFDRTNRQDIKTLAILPLSAQHMALAEDFCTRLYRQIAATDSVAILTKASVLDALGRQAFTACGKLRLMEWLNGLEDRNRIVIYFAADSPNSPWTKQCIRQADCIFMVADANSDTMISRESYAQINESNLGEYERVLLGLPSRPKIELVLVHPTRNCSSGLAQSWLEPRPWITQHHHVMMTKNVPIVEGNSLDERQRRRRQSRLAVPDLVNRPGSNASNYNHGQNANVDLEDDHSVEDIARMARRVLGNSIGLVLGGGGARGIAHLGVIKAFIDAGVPIDVIGGTSIGALVGGLYSRDANSDTSQALLAWFSSRLSSWWRVCYEMTYPFCGWTTGAGFNRCIWRLFERRCIEDMWVPFFCVSTDITRSCMRIHREGLGWRCIRASMTISGFLPPLWDANDDGSGSLLLDGVYVNNLPADVLARDFDYVGTIIAVDVGSELNESNEPIEDEQSGLWLLLKSISGQRVHVPSLADMQNRLAYIACEEGIRRVKEAAEDPESRVHYIRPPVQRFSAMGFGQFQEILKEGEAYGLEIIGKWRADGTLSRIKGITEGNPVNAAGTAASLSLGHFEAMQRRKSMRHSL